MSDNLGDKLDGIFLAHQSRIENSLRGIIDYFDKWIGESATRQQSGPIFEYLSQRFV